MDDAGAMADAMVAGAMDAGMGATRMDVAIRLTMAMEMDDSEAPRFGSATTTTDCSRPGRSLTLDVTGWRRRRRTMWQVVAPAPVTGAGKRTRADRATGRLPRGKLTRYFRVPRRLA